MRRRRAVIGAALILSTGIATAGSGTSSAASSASTPTSTSSRVLRAALPADQARQLVGDDALVRANPALGAGRVRDLLDDETTWVDTTGALFVMDDAVPALRTQAVTDPVLASPYTASKTFLLHSRPGAQRTIHLDFDGATTTGTQWNTNADDVSFTSPAYDTDGNASTFSATELAEIQTIWQRVAEDYAPFDIDVTTQDPGLAAIERLGSNDLVYGTRVVITQNNPVQNYCGKCSGVASLGAFSRSSSHEYYQPAWMFTTYFGDQTGLAYLATGVSHEVGHTLGLHHDGSSTEEYYPGHGLWGPIMGASHTDGLVQWSKGEYLDANNVEDDFAVMQRFGAPLLADDVGDTIDTATVLPALPFDVAGLLTSGSDVDVYRVALPIGRFDANALPAAVGANTDLRLTLRNAKGLAVASGAPANSVSPNSDEARGTAAHLKYVVAVAGTYYLTVGSTGAGDPLLTGYTRYGSAGRYRLTNVMPKVTVTKSGTGVGTIVSVNGAPCGLSCTVAVYPQAPVTIVTRAGANGLSVLSRWTGATCTGTNTATCTFDMRAATTRIDARFEARQTLHTTVESTAIAPTGYQFIRSDLSGISCAAGYTSGCLAQFGTSRTVTLRPYIPTTPAPNFAFAFWTGACTGNTPTCRVAMSAARDVTAHFAVGRALTITIPKSFYGRVDSNWLERGCPVAYDGNQCVHMMPRFAKVTLTAVAQPLATFTGWTGACTGTAPTCAVTMDEARTVTATFVRSP